MANILDYVESYGKYTFDEKEFNEVDSLVLSSLSYIDLESREAKKNKKLKKKDFDLSETFDAIIDSLFSINKNKLSELSLDENFEDRFLNFFSEDKLKRLYFEIISSKRFKDIRYDYFVNKIDEKKEVQFSAVTYFLNQNDVYIAFRGTDTTLVGWKEDFNMSFMESVPAQGESVKYITSVLQRELPRKIYIGGHSKGGNLAAYSYIKAPSILTKNVVAVYNHDGPGFSKGFLASDEYKDKSSKLNKSMPKTALIGMFLNQPETYKIVESTSVGIFQHDPFSWCIIEDKFKEAHHMDIESVKVREVVNEFLVHTDEETRRKFVDVIYDVLKSSESKTFPDLKKNWYKNAVEIIKAAAEVDDETKEFLYETTKMLVKVAISTLSETRINPKCFYCGRKMEYYKNYNDTELKFYCSKCNKTFVEYIDIKK